MEYIIDFFLLFIVNSKIRIARAIEFRINFIIELVTAFCYACVVPVFQFLIYTNAYGYPQWSFDQMFVFTSMLLFWTGIVDTLFGEVISLFDNLIMNGLFDRILVLPYPSIIIILSKGFAFRSVGTMFAGIIALVYSLFHLGITIFWWQLIIFLFLIFIGLLFYLAIIIFYCTLTLLMINTIRLKDIIYKFISYSSFPVEIFSKALKLVYLVVLPIAVWIYFPVQSLLGRLDVFVMFGSISSIIFFIISLIVWKMQMKKYTSAGG